MSKLDETVEGVSARAAALSAIATTAPARQVRDCFRTGQNCTAFHPTTYHLFKPLKTRLQSELLPRATRATFFINERFAAAAPQNPMPSLRSGLGRSRPA